MNTKKLKDGWTMAKAPNVYLNDVLHIHNYKCIMLKHGNFIMGMVPDFKDVE